MFFLRIVQEIAEPRGKYRDLAPSSAIVGGRLLVSAY